MAKFPLFYVIFCCLCVFSADGFRTWKRRERSAEGDWGYTPQNGPSTWGGLCRTGNRQSPINIKLGETIVKKFPAFAFEENYLRKHKLYAKNNGHTVLVALDDDSVRPTLLGGGLDGKFIFQQLHMHWESEHEFEGKRADLEMHMVHYNSKYKSFEEAVTKPDGIVVLGVIFDEAKETDDLLEEFFAFALDSSSLDHGPHHPASPDNSLPGVETEESSGSFALRDLLPKRLSRFFRYEGSLTTPHCGEVVQWTIFINRLPVSRRVLEALRTLKDHDGNVLTENYRPPQNLNNREVFIQIKNDDEDSDQGGYVGGSSKTFLSINLLCCCLFLLSKYN